VRGKIGRGIADFLAHRGDATSPRVLLAGPTGSGKTEMVGRQLPRLIEDDKAEGRPYRVIIMVPAHRLGDQICARYQALGVNAATYKGRGDPFDGASASELCQNMTEVRLAVIAQEEVATAVCDNTKRKTQCPFRSGCKCYEQLDRATAADVVFVAHNFIFQAVPEQLFANVGTVVIEEDFTTHGVGTVELLPIDTFNEKAADQAAGAPRQEAGAHDQLFRDQRSRPLVPQNRARPYHGGIGAEHTAGRATHRGADR
jgi:hypothetical protein